MDPWIYQQLADERLVDVPERTDHTGVPALAQADAVDVTEGLAERIDGWCEDRPAEQLSDEDGRD